MSRKTYVSLPQYSLQAIFPGDTLEDLVQLARDRVLNAFDRATEMHRGKRYGTDNYIRESAKPGGLVAYVTRSHMRPFVSIETLPHLPQQLCGLREHEHVELINQLHKQAVELAIDALRRQHVIWYDEARGVWNVCQSALDDWRKTGRNVRRAIKFDRRNYHGKVRGQSKRRGIPAGAPNSIMQAA